MHGQKRLWPIFEKDGFRKVDDKVFHFSDHEYGAFACDLEVGADAPTVLTDPMVLYEYFKFHPLTAWALSIGYQYAMNLANGQGGKEAEEQGCRGAEGPLQCGMSNSECGIERQRSGVRGGGTGSGRRKAEGQGS